MVRRADLCHPVLFPLLLLFLLFLPGARKSLEGRVEGRKERERERERREEEVAFAAG